jgi:hypothetical protein
MLLIENHLVITVTNRIEYTAKDMTIQENQLKEQPGDSHSDLGSFFH